jgi:Putative Ig domain
VNSAPILSAITNRTINEGFFLRITNQAIDLDVPANILTWSLSGPVAPGASINTTNGLFTWTPNNTQGPSTNLFTVVVTDNGSPVMSATQQFTVIVRDVLSDFTLSLASTNVVGGDGNTVPMVLKSSLPLTNITLRLVSSSSLVTNLGLRPLNSEVTLASVSPLGSNAYSLKLNLDPAQQTDAIRSIATLDFLSLSNNHSAIVFLNPSQLLGGQTGGPVITNGAAFGSRIIIVSPEPVLDITPGVPVALTLYGKSSNTYTLSSTTNLALGAWFNPTNLTLTNNSIVLPIPNLAPATFYRAQQQ